MGEGSKFGQDEAEEEQGWDWDAQRASKHQPTRGRETRLSVLVSWVTGWSRYLTYFKTRRVARLGCGGVGKGR